MTDRRTLASSGLQIGIRALILGAYAAYVTDAAWSPQAGTRALHRNTHRGIKVGSIRARVAVGAKTLATQVAARLGANHEQRSHDPDEPQRGCPAGVGVGAGGGGPPR